MERPELGAPDLRIHYIRVTNNMDVDFTDMFDGVPVTIEAHRTQNLQLDMAAHFFGYGYEVDPQVMFRHTCKRQGWNTIDHLKIQPSGKSLAEELFAKFDIKPVIYKMVEEKPDLDAPIPADPSPDDELPNPLPKRRAGAA